jgi:hypothetical protein
MTHDDTKYGTQLLHSDEETAIRSQQEIHRYNCMQVLQQDISLAAEGALSV